MQTHIFKDIRTERNLSEFGGCLTNEPEFLFQKVFENSRWNYAFQLVSGISLF